jgi:acyl carrier protein
MTNNDLLQRITQTISAVLDINPEKISRETSSQNVHNWDSLNHIKVVVSLEEEFEMEFDPEEISVMTSVEKIENLIYQKFMS